MCVFRHTSPCVCHEFTLAIKLHEKNSDGFGGGWLLEEPFIIPECLGPVPWRTLHLFFFNLVFTSLAYEITTNNELLWLRGEKKEQH